MLPAHPEREVALPATLLTRSRDAAVHAQQYLLEHQSPIGGFCFYRWQGLDEPNLRDTWHALAALTLLGAEVPRRGAVAAFLATFTPLGLDDLCNQARALERLGCSDAVDTLNREKIAALDAAAVLVDQHLPVSARLDHALRILRVQQCLSTIRRPAESAACARTLEHDGGWGDKPNLGDTWSALAVLDACGDHSFTDATRQFVDALQIASFGFKATLDSMYVHLGVTYAGVSACNLLALPLRHAAAAVDFVLACQTGDGGFARAPSALPDIALTHRALQALITAGALAGPSTPALPASV